jgi:hypothetical protein
MKARRGTQRDERGKAEERDEGNEEAPSDDGAGHSRHMRE